MSGKADVLHRWLGIPPEEQPPNHYRLLGANLFEPSEEVIRHLAYQRKVALKIIEKGPEREQVQHLIKAIETAAECLVDPKTKSEYDRFLRLQIDVAARNAHAATNEEPPSPFAPQDSVSVAATADPIGDRVMRTYRKRGRKRSSVARRVVLALQIMAGGLMGSALAVFILWHAAGTDPFGLFANKQTDGPYEPPSINGPREDGSKQPNVLKDESGFAPPNSESVQPEDSDKESESPDERLHPEPSNLYPGLLAHLYDTTVNEYVHPSRLDPPSSDAFIVESVTPWTFDRSKSAAAVGYLRIDEPGNYVFHSWNFYDRNVLVIDGQVVCGFRTRDFKPVRLEKGYVPIASVGYFSCRGTVEVRWKKEHEPESALAPIPPELLFHDPDANPQMFFGSDSATQDLLPGLTGWLFDPHPSQTGRDLYVHPSKLGDPIGEPFIRTSLTPHWGFDGSKNGILVGYLRIDEPDVYVFHTYNYYDFNALFVDRKLVCPFRGSVAGGTSGSPSKSQERIVLSKGLVPIASVGFVGCRGTVKVLWAKAGDQDFVPIPPELLLHAPTSNLRDFFGDDTNDKPFQADVLETPRESEIPPHDENTELSEHGVRIELPSGAVVDSNAFANDAAALAALADSAEPVISVEYADGSHLGTAQHKSGKFNGLAFANYSDEYPKFVGQYKDGRRDGNFTSWGPEGKIRFWAQFRAGTLHGLACFFEDERLKLVLEYSVKNLRGVHIVENGAPIQSFESDTDLPVGVLDSLRRFELYEKESKEQEKELEEKLREMWRDFQSDLIRERKINASIRLKQKRAERAKKAADYLRALSRAGGF